MECVLMSLKYCTGDNLYYLANMFHISPVLPPTLWDLGNPLWKDQQIKFFFPINNFIN